MKLNLRKMREASPLTQQEMADKLNVALRTYQYIENGGRKPTCDVIIALQKFFEKPIDYLLEQEVTPEE